MLEMENLNKPNRKQRENFTNRLDHVEERISEIEDKVKEILHSESNGKKTQQA
jgi:uncharacterized protein (UPF0335 family)